MRDAIVRARPSTVALVGVTPLVIAIAAVATAPRATGSQVILAAALLAACGMLLGWAWMVGHALALRTGAAARPRIGRFRAATLYCAIYFCGFVAIGYGNRGGLLIAVPGAMLIAFALHLLAMAALLAIFHFVATALEYAEQAIGLPATPARTTLLLLSSIAGFLPVQRRINRVFESEPAATSARPLATSH